MDIIDRTIEAFINSFNPEISEAELDEFKRARRIEDGGQKHYAFSVIAFDSLQRGRDIFALMKAGLTTAQIADRLGISQRCVQKYIARTPLA